MEYSRTQWRQKQRYGEQEGVLEPHYDVVDDQEAVHNVHIQPARPINDEREYADRDLPRSSSVQSLPSGLATDNSIIHPTYPPRKTTAKPAKKIHRNKRHQAPTINRDLKPGRSKNRTADQLQSPQCINPPSRRCPPSPQFPSELLEQLNGMTLQDNSRGRVKRPTKNVSKFNSLSKGSYAECEQSSVDEESQHIAQRWPKELESEDMVNLQHNQHERPQNQVEFEQHNFDSTEISQNHWEYDWYIGPCSRTDAEHALHLVNKDGAFLVRDCSLNSNSEPFVLSVYYEKKVYNVKIRFIENHRKYALGTGQRSNEMFDSVADIIKFHSIFPVVLISGKCLHGDKCTENCVLICPVTKRDVDQLLR